MKKLLLFFIRQSLIFRASAVDDARMMRYPDINGNLVAFVYAGDIGRSKHGREANDSPHMREPNFFPKISPDGKWIAFSQNIRKPQIWVMPAGGGQHASSHFTNSEG